MKRCVKCDGPIPSPVLGDDPDERCPLCGDEPPEVVEVAEVMAARLREAAASTAERAEALTIDERDSILGVCAWGAEEDQAWQLARLMLVVEESLDDHMGGVRYPEVASAIARDVWAWLERGEVEPDPMVSPHRYVPSGVAQWRTCNVCGRGAFAGIHRGAK